MVRLAVFVDGEQVQGLRKRQFRCRRLKPAIQLLAEHIRQVVAEATPEPLELFRTYDDTSAHDRWPAADERLGIDRAFMCAIARVSG